MGGFVPLGYDARDRKLVVKEAEAALVRRIFEGFAETRSVTKLVAALRAEGHLTKRGRAFTKSDVYRALGSPTLFAIGNRSERPTCLIEQAVNVVLDDTLKEAEARITARLQTLTLAALAGDFQSRLHLSLCAPQENIHAL